MNADEIVDIDTVVRALRWYAKVTTYCEDNIVNCRECEFHGFCTDPYSDDGIAMMRERLEQAADTIESLQAQLSASQRRERAAGIIKDDSFQCIELTVKGDYDRNRPRTEIEVQGA